MWVFGFGFSCSHFAWMQVLQVMLLTWTIQYTHIYIDVHITVTDIIFYFLLILGKHKIKSNSIFLFFCEWIFILFQLPRLDQVSEIGPTGKCYHPLPIKKIK